MVLLLSRVGSRTLAKAAVVCALTLTVISPVRAQDTSSSTTDACEISDGDKSFGIRAVDDATCVSGGLGCYNDHCRFCKVLESPQSSSFENCTSFGVDFPTMAPLIASTDSCEVSSGDAAVGISAFTDDTCLYGGLGCFSNHCRFCKEKNTAQSEAFVECPNGSSAGSATLTADDSSSSDSNSTDTIGCAIEPAAGDIEVGISIGTDPTCSNGGLGCINDVCRFCRIRTTTKSVIYSDCSFIGSDAANSLVTPSEVPVTSTENPAAVNDIPTAATTTSVATTNSPSDSTDAPAATTEAPSDSSKDMATTTSASPVSTNAPTASTEVPSYSTDAPNVTTEAPSDSSKATAATPEVPSDVTNAPPATTEVPSDSTDAPNVTTEAPSDSSQNTAATSEVPTDVTKAPPATTELPSDSTDAPVGTTKAPSDSTDAPLVGTNAPADSPAAPATETCTITASVGDAAVGINIVSDPTCVSGGVGCLTDVCRFCKVTTSPQSAAFKDCALFATDRSTPDVPVAIHSTSDEGDSSTDDDNTTDDSFSTDASADDSGVTETPAPTSSASATTNPSTGNPTEQKCTQSVSAGDASVGINIVTDASCKAGGVGCFDEICRFCKIFETPQSTAFVDCASTTSTTSAAADAINTDVASNESIEAPADDATEAPADDLAEAPADDATEAPVDDAIEPTTTDATESPADGAIEAPLDGSSIATTEDSTDGVTDASSDSTTISPSGESCTQTVSDGDAAAGIEIVTDASCSAGGVGCIDTICRFCKVSETSQSAAFVDCSSITSVEALTANTKGETSTQSTAHEADSVFVSKAQFGAVIAGCVGAIVAVAIVAFAIKRSLNRTTNVGESLNDEELEKIETGDRVAPDTVSAEDLATAEA